MDKNVKTIVITLFSAIILLGVLVLIAVNSRGKKQEEPKIEEKPKITEEYTDVSLNTIKSYNNELVYDGTQVTYYDDEKDELHLVYKDGIIYDNKIIDIEDNNAKVDFKKYTLRYEIDGSNYVLLDKSNNKEINYFEIMVITNNKSAYLVLTAEDDDDVIKLTLLNPDTGETLDLSKLNVDYIPGGYAADLIELTYNDYLPVCSSYNKCGLITYKGETVIEYIYDNIEYYGKDYIIASKNGKYGIINYKNEEKLKFEYEEIINYGDYVAVVKDKKLSVLNSKYEAILKDVEVDYEDGDYAYYGIEEDDNKLYIVTTGNNSGIYYINKTLKKQINIKGRHDRINIDDNTFYFMYTYEKDNNIVFDIYDSELYPYYKFEKPIKKNIDYSVGTEQLNKNKYYFELTLYYDLDQYSETYYIDLKNSKELNEYDALSEYFKNGYSYVITPGKLKIYKETELLNEFDGYYMYIGDYKFKKQNSILEVEFKKESREVSQ